MRKILFRGVSDSSFEWIEGYLFKLGEGTPYEETYILGDLDFRNTVYDVWQCAERVIPETVSEFTGFYDLNGKKIFENDILERKVSRKYWSNRMYIQYRKGSFELWDFDENIDFLSNWCAEAYRNGEDVGGCYIVGNIFDNKDLMEVSND